MAPEVAEHMGPSIGHATCDLQGKKMEELAVTFEDVQIRQAVTAEEGQKVALAVLIAPDHRFNVSILLANCCRVYTAT